jgi:NAD(P)-dependent dehydrogenase (short-subunit alcohol dehydrogenase family)
MEFGLTGKTGVIAGGSRGIGKAIALELAREGADLVVAARGAEALKETADEISGKTGRKIVPLAFDATDRASCEALIERAAKELGSVNILINSASVPIGSPSATGPIETLDEAALMSDFDIKYMGALRLCRAVLPHMKKAGYGRIINISGGNARVPGNLSGGARNSALVHLSRTLALQYGRDGINVNCIHPGVTRTERTAKVLAERAAKAGTTPEAVERQDFEPGGARSNAIGRMIEAQEIGWLVAFLASEKGRAITGELISPNGGQGNSVYY